MLKDRLKEVIQVKMNDGIICNYNGIDKLIKAWYQGVLEDKQITYKGIALDIAYEEITNKDGETTYETDFLTIRKDLQEQIDSINDMFKVGE